jgi:D-glycero-D-manno-heptose 1,7-bisphosphate phosphatase
MRPEACRAPSSQPATAAKSIQVNLNKAVFLDRDGTIIFDGHYIHEPDQVKLLPGAQEAIALLKKSGYLLFLFTNQSGVGRGLFPLQAVHRCNQRMLDLLGFGNELFSDVCIATEHPEERPVYRKPNPRFITECVAKYALDPSRSWMTGDKPIDAEAGLNAGIQAALIESHHHSAESGVPRYPSLLAFAKDVTGGLALEARPRTSHH